MSADPRRRTALNEGSRSWRVPALSGLKTLERKSTSDHISDELRQMIIEGHAGARRTTRRSQDRRTTRRVSRPGAGGAPAARAAEAAGCGPQQGRLRGQLLGRPTSGRSTTPVARSRATRPSGSSTEGQGRAPARPMSCGRCWTACEWPSSGAISRQISAADLDFHMTLVASAGNSRLVDAYSILSAQSPGVYQPARDRHPVG